MKWIIPVVLIGLAAVSSAEHQSPTPQDVEFGGRVTAARDSDALLAGSVQINDRVDGSFELVAPLRNERSIFLPGVSNPPTIEQIDYSSRCGDLTAAVGSSILVAARGIDVDTTDFAAGEGSDRYSVRGTGFVSRPAPELPPLIRSDGSLRLRIDAMTELVGQIDRASIGKRNVRRRFEIASESEGALLDYIRKGVLVLDVTQPDP